MTNSILRNTKAEQQESEEVNSGSGCIRFIIRNVFNRALAATKGFLRRHTSDSDHTHVVDETNRSRNPFADPNLWQPSVELSVNAYPSAIQTRRNANRIAEAFGARNPPHGAQENIMTQYPEARDIRPSALRNRRLLSMRSSAFPEIKNRDKRTFEIGSQKRRTYCRRIRRRLSVEAASTDRFVRCNNICRLIGRNGLVAPERVIDDGNVSSNGVQITAANRVRRRRRRKYVRNGRTDWRKYEEDRSKWPLRLVKRKREVTSESLVEEPEHKIPKIAQYWVIQKASTDGENNDGQMQGERIVLDWDQYELERSLWPRVCVKRKRETELESLSEEPKQKVRRIVE